MNCRELKIGSECTRQSTKLEVEFGKPVAILGNPIHFYQKLGERASQKTKKQKKPKEI
jgi:hypothetical protein